MANKSLNGVLQHLRKVAAVQTSRQCAAHPPAVPRRSFRRSSKFQTQYYRQLLATKEQGEVAKITQNYLDRLGKYVKDHPKNDDAPDAVLQILRVYESQGKTVEANAWREKLLKEHPASAAAKAAK